MASGTKKARKGKAPVVANSEVLGVMNATASRFSRCVVCGTRKTADEFRSPNGRRLPTCSDCIANVDPKSSPSAWTEEAFPPIALPDNQRPHKRSFAEFAGPEADGVLVSPSSSSKAQLHQQSPAPRVLARDKTATNATCRICVEDKVKWAFIHDVTDAPEPCLQHLGFFEAQEPTCKDCVTTYLSTAIDQKGAERVGCLDDDCDAAWNHKYIQKYLDQDEFTRYGDSLFKTFLVTNRSFMPCSRPECNGGGFIDMYRRGYPQLECGDCKTRLCGICKTLWHKDLTCQQFRERNGIDREDKKVAHELSKQDARRCMHCQLVVLKDGGCDNMWCPHCKRDFYWAAAEKITGSIREMPKRAATKRFATAAPPPLPRFMHGQMEICEADVPPPTPLPIPQPFMLGFQLPGFPPPPFPPPVANRLPMQGVRPGRVRRRGRDAGRS